MLPILLAGLTWAAQSVSLKTADGKSIHAQASTAKGAKVGVLLVHMKGGSSADFGGLLERFARSSTHAIAPDLRGHGQSQSQAPDLADEDYLAMIEDVRAALVYLKDQGAEQVACVGASIGANLCLNLAAETPEVANLVLLSPGLNYQGLKVLDALERYGDRPLLMVASAEDSYSARTLTAMEPRAKGQVESSLLQGAGHGSRMLSREVGLEGKVMAWVLGTYVISSGEVVVPKIGVGVDDQEIETRGQKLNAHQQ